MRKFFKISNLVLLCTVLFLLMAGPAHCQVSDVRVNYQGLSSTLVKAQAFSAYASPGRTFLLNVQPNYAATIILQNLGGSTDTETLTCYWTANPSVVDRSNNTGQWQVLQTSLLPGGALSNSQTIALTATTTAAISTPTTNGVQIAVNISSTAVNADLFNLFVTFVPAASNPTSNSGGAGGTSSQVSGTVAQSGSSVGLNPVLISGQSAGNLNIAIAEQGNGLVMGNGSTTLVDGVTSTTVTEQGGGAIIFEPSAEFVQNGAGWDRAFYCTGVASFTSAAAGTVAIVAPSGSTAIRVCDVFYTTGTTAAATFQFEYGTGAACVTSPVTLTPAMTMNTATQANVSAGAFSIFKTPASQGLCIVTAGTTVAIQGFVTYAQY